MVGNAEFVGVALYGDTISRLIAQSRTRENVAVFRHGHNPLNVGVHVSGQVSRVRQRAHAHFRVLAEEIRREITRNDIRLAMLRRRAENQYWPLPGGHILQEDVQL